MAKSFHYYLRKKDRSDGALIKTIERSIKDLKLAVDSFVIVDLVGQKSVRPRVAFFQTARKRSFRKTNLYVYEIRIDTPSSDGVQRNMYSADNCLLADVLQAFEDICIQGVLPDISRLRDITDKIFGGLKRGIDFDRAKQFVRQYCDASILTMLQRCCYEESLRYISKFNNYDINEIYMQRAEICIRNGRYERARDFYAEMTYYDTAAYRLADMIREGKLGKPNYKQAYEYYHHTTLLEEDSFRELAKLQIARMYRDGKYLKQSYEKYLRIVNGLERKLLRPYKRFNFCIPELYYELALIKRHKGDKETALAYCQQARLWAYKMAYHGDISFSAVEHIAKLYYVLTEFDENDMELMDLAYLAQEPMVAVFYHQGTIRRVEAIEKDGRVRIRFEGKWFRGAADFLRRAALCGKCILECSKEIQFIEVIR